MSQVCLTNLSVAGGCGCKLDPSSLQAILTHLKGNKKDERLVLGFDTADDCAVYEYSQDNLMLYTTDFFTPLVDDPYVYGALAAANALSDVFAMGGKPLIANVILGFPPDQVSPSTIKEIMRGGQEEMDTAGCTIVGGHTIVNPQPIYGFSIVGQVDRNNLKTNAGAKEGDLLLLTKPIGSGILSSALKLGLLSHYCYQQMLPYLLELNACGYQLGAIKQVHAMTDLTGFGLVGHALEMANGAGLSIEIDSSKVELFEGTADLCGAVVSPQSGAAKNLKSYKDAIEFIGNWSTDQMHLMCDPQSNGGLLIAVSPDVLEQVQQVLNAYNGRKGKVIGAFKKKVKGKPPLTLKRDL